MTKQVRIENADTSTYKVAVEAWHKGRDGAPDTLIQTFPLGHPTAMCETHLTDSRYLIVKELPANA